MPQTCLEIEYDEHVFSALFRRVCKIAKSGYHFRHVRPSAWNSSALTERILIKFDIWGVFFKKICRKNLRFLESEKNNEYITWIRFHIYDSISLNSS